MNISNRAYVASDRDLSNHFVAFIIIMLMVMFAFARIWVHQEDSAFNYEAQGVAPYFVLAFLLFFIFLKILISSKEIASCKASSFFVVLLLSIFGLIYYLVIGDYTLLIAALAAFALLDIEPSFIVVCTGILSLLFVVLQMVGYSIGWFYDVPTKDWIRDVSSGSRLRVAFGFGHPNRVFSYILPGWIACFYLKDKNKRRILLASCLILTLIDYLFTDSRTLFIVLFFLCLYKPILYLMKRYRVIRQLSAVSFGLLLMLSIVLAKTIGTSGNVINSLLSGRPQWWSYYINSGFVLIGSSDGAQQIFRSNLPLDNYMLNILYRGGLFFVLVIMALYFVYTKRLLSEKNYRTVFSILALFVYGISEPSVKLIVAPFFPLIFISILNSGSQKSAQETFVQMGKQRGARNKRFSNS